MKNLIRIALGLSVVGGVFVAGVAVGKSHNTAQFVVREDVKWEDVGGPKLGVLAGDSKKGPFIGLLQVPAGTTSPVHAHSGDYEAVEVEGTSTHWMKGEDGTKAKKMTPGSYWKMPGKAMHTSQCEKGKDCVIALIQKTKFDFIPDKDAKTPAKEPAKEPAKTPAKEPAKEPAKKP